MQKNLTCGKPNDSKNQPITSKNNKTAVYLLGSSDVIDWMERNSTGAEQTNAVLKSMRMQTVQTTQPYANDKSQYE